MKVSIIIPAYNAADTIEETLRSALSQTYSNLEVIVSCNNCTDSTEELAHNIAKLDTRVKVIAPAVTGAAAARNSGVSLSTGEYVAYLDADDLWTSTKIEDQVQALETNPKAVLAYSLTTFINEKGGFLFNQAPIKHEGYILPALLVSNFLVCGSMCLVRRSAIDRIGEWDVELLSTHDWDYWIRLAEIGEFALVPHYQVFYRQSSTNISSNVERRVKYYLLTIDKTFARMPQHLQVLKRQALANAHKHFAVLYLYKRNDVENSRIHLAKAINYSPLIVFNKQTFKLMLSLVIRSSKNVLRLIPG